MVYDLAGRQVTELVNANQTAGIRLVRWNGDQYASGVYFVKLVTPEYTETQKIMLLK